jgi:hypothetical protein
MLWQSFPSILTSGPVIIRSVEPGQGEARGPRCQEISQGDAWLACMAQDIQYPVADLEGDLVWATDLSSSLSRPSFAPFSNGSIRRLLGAIQGTDDFSIV